MIAHLTFAPPLGAPQYRPAAAISFRHSDWKESVGTATPSFPDQQATMPLTPRHPWLEVEQIGEVTLVRCTRRHILTQEAVEIVAGQLVNLLENEGRRNLVLNLGNIERLATAMLGKLITLHKKLKAAGGRLVLCRIPPHLYEIFTLLKLPSLLDIYARESETLQTFRGYGR